MNFKNILFSLIIALSAGTSAYSATVLKDNGEILFHQTDITTKIPEMPQALDQFHKIPSVAQYGHADWNNVIGIAHNVTRSEAAAIAEANSEISYFFWVKGMVMVLELEPYDEIRVFHHGDAVFFTGTPWWGSAPGLADGYLKLGHPNQGDDSLD